MAFEQTPYGRVAIAHESHDELLTLFSEVEEYFDCGAVLQQGDTVVDVGANIGAFAVACAKRTDGKVRMLGFEPVPVLFAALDTNLRENEWLARGTHRAFNVALSSAEEAGKPCDFYYFKRFPRDSTMDIDTKRREFELFVEGVGKRITKRFPPFWPIAATATALQRYTRFGQWVADVAAGMEVLKVPRETLPSMLATVSGVERIDLLKVDVEGAEGKVLAGLDDPTWAKVRQVAIEADGLPHTVSALKSLVLSKGLTDLTIFNPPSIADRGLPNILLYAKRPAG